MAAPSVVSISHAHGSEGHELNLGIDITFAEALDSTTVNANTFLLSDLDTSEEVSVTISIDPSTASATTKIVVQPKYLLTENNNYRLTIVGTDRRIVQELASSDGSKLATSLVYEFKTGDDLFIKDSSVAKNADDKTLEGDLFLPSNVKALGTDLTVEKVRPKNHTWQNNPNLTGDNKVIFTFSKTLSGTASGILDWATIDVYPLLDTAYLAISGNLATTNSGVLDFTLPTGTVSVTGNQLVVTFDRDFPNNAGVEITLDDEIAASDGEEYGGALRYAIAIQPYPEVFNVRAVKREIRAAADDFHDDWVAALLHKNFVLFWEKFGRIQAPGTLSWPAKKYILYSTVLDIIEDKDYEKFLVSGTLKQLGDLNVSAYNLSGRIALKVTKLQKELDLLLETMRRGWQFSTAVKQEGGEGVVSRLWYDVNGRYTAPSEKFNQPNAPISNTPKSRHAGTNNPWI